MAIVFVDAITPTGTQNGVNKVFSLPQAPDPPASLMLLFNGQAQTQGTDYILTGTTITYTAGHPAPRSTDLVVASFRYNSINTGGGALTARDLIYRAYRISHVLGNAMRDFSDVNGSYYTEGFNVLNGMIDQWAAQRLTILSLSQSDFSLVPGQQEYTVGPGGNFNITRPSRIERANLVAISENPAQPIEIPMEVLTLDGWRSIPQKSVQSVYPLQLYYNQADSAGVGKVYVFPIPTIINTLRLFLWVPLSQFAAITDGVVLAPGYLKALIYCLAKELSMWFPERSNWDAQREKESNDAMEWIKSMNVPMLDLVCDESLVNAPGGMWNWRTGTYQGRAY